MLTFRAINASWPRGIQFAAFAGLASVSLLGHQTSELHAEWFAFKKIPAPVEAHEPQPNEGFDKAIRNSLKEANRLEKKGELDQAIILAERAAKISQESSSLVKIAPDISSSAILDYVKELRSKKEKIELSKKRAKTPTSNTTAIASTRVKKELPAKEKATRTPSVKPLVAPPEQVATKAREKEHSGWDSELTLRDEPISSRPKSRPNYGSTVALSSTAKLRADYEPDELPSSSEQSVLRETTTKIANNVSTPVAAEEDEEELALDPFLEAEPAQKQVSPDIRSFPQNTVASTEVVPEEEEIVTPDPERITLTSSPPIDSKHTTSPSEPRPVKLRSRYQDAEALPTTSDKSSNGVPPRKFETNVTPALNETEENLIEPEEQALDDRQEDEFPVIQVRDLRQEEEATSARNQSSTPTISKEESLEADQERQAAPEKTLSPFRIRRSLKLRNNYSVLPLLTPFVARPTREPVVASTSMIHWRPAKETIAATAGDTTPENESKSNESALEIRRMQSDNDKSIIDHIATGIRHGSARDKEIQPAHEESSSVANDSRPIDENSTVARREIRGSLWDHAAVPTFEGTWKPAKSQSTKQHIAPLPPKTTRVEQTAFIESRPIAKNDLRSDLSRSSTEVTAQVSNSSLESSKETADLSETTTQEQVAKSRSTNDDMEWANEIATGDSVQHSTSGTELPESTVSTMLGAFGVALLIAGIWMVRATAGIKHA